MHGRRVYWTLAAVAAASLPLMTAPAALAQSEGAFGGGLPFGLQDLPPGLLRSKIEGLPQPAQQRALAWLNSFEFSEADLPYLMADDEGGIFYADSFLPEPVEQADGEEGGAPGPAESVTAATVFTLHSNPGAPNVVYIDVDGHVITNTAWNSTHASLRAKPYDTDGNPASFSQSEVDDIAEIWHRVAEDLAPFDIDVTTEEPASFNSTTGRILITDDEDEDGKAMPAKGAGGVAYVNVWGRSNYHTYYSPALVYADNLGPDFPPFLAEASSHELGHNLALSHDGQGSTTYYGGHGSGFISWAPIMGNSYSRNVTQWSKGEYSNPTNIQDDLAIIEGFLTYRVDDHSDGLAGATALAVEPNGDVLVSNPETDPDNLFPENKGIIEESIDSDVFFFDNGTGAVNLTVTPAWDAHERSSRRGANLDIDATLYDAGGGVVAQSNPSDNTDASISVASLPSGRYYLEITGSGSANYSDYASLGQYFISGTVTPGTADDTEPTPNPMAFSSLPAAQGKGAITMTATLATDDSGVVEYNFECVAGGQGCGSSGWQAGRDYTATGLAAGTSYSFHVKARDGSGNETDWSSTASATTDANNNPLAADDSDTVAEDSSVAIAVLTNDSDGDGDSLSVQSVTQGTNGSVINNGGSVTYTPDANFFGIDSFTYVVSDGFGGTDSATVTVTVTAVNDAPTVQNDSAEVGTNASATIDVLANDSDPDGDSLTVIAVTQGNKGSVAIVGGQVVYTAGSKRGGDSFSYTASDGNGGSATATVSISLTKGGDGGGGGGGNGGGGNGGCHPKKGC